MTKSKRQLAHCKAMGHKNKTHGKSRTQAYYAWRRMNGSRVSEWDDIAVFLRDMGHAPEGTQMYRPDRYKPYGPGNAFWTTQGQRRQLRAEYLASFA